MKNKRNILFRRVILALLIWFTFTLQCTFLPRLGINLPVMYIIPIVFSAAMFEKEFTGMFLGLLAGILWDTASALPDGTMALSLSVLCCITGLLTRYILRNTLLSALVINMFAVTFFTVIHIIAFIGDTDYSVLEGIILTKYLPAAFITVILTVPCYFAVRQITQKMRIKKDF